MSNKLSSLGGSGVFVARPTLAVVLNLLIILAGLTAFLSVDIREMPDVDQPVISVRTSYTGASPETVDSEVTGVLEDALTSLEGISNISSQSSFGSSRITIDLKSGTDTDVAANSAREIISQQSRQLPDDLETPTVTKSDSDADPIMRLALLGNLSLDALSHIATDDVVNDLKTIGGVAEVETVGTQEKEFLVRVNMTAMIARKLSISDLESALGTLRNDAPLGQLDSATQSVTLRTNNPEITEDDISNLRVGDTARVKDVAFVQLTAKERSVFLQANGRTGIGLNIIRQSEGNTLSISLGVREAVERLSKTLPEGVELSITSDDGVYIEQSINEVAKSIGLAVLIVIAVIFLFLRSWRATLIPTLAIPVSLIGTIAAIWIAGFSVNTITLLALVLSTGMVVDDAIVVVENIVRHRRMGKGPRAAAIHGTKEVFFAVISTTATLAAVFIPISFLPGQAGGIFSEFGFVLAFSVMISSLVALTLVPMLSSILDPGAWLKDEQEDDNAEEKKHSTLARLYLNFMDRALKAPIYVIAASVIFVGIAFFTYSSLQSELTPTEDRGFFIIVGRGPSGVSSEYTRTQIEQVEAAVEPFRESGAVETVMAISGFGGGGSGFVIVRLKDWAERDQSQQEIMSKLNQSLSKIPGLTVSARSGNSLGIRGAGRGLQVGITGNDFETLVSEGEKLVEAMKLEPEIFSNPQVSYDTSEPLIEMDIDKEMASELGISTADVSALINVMTSGSTPQSVFVEGLETDIRIAIGGPPIDDAGDLERVFISNKSGDYLPLSTVVSFKQAASAARLSRENGDKTIPVSANLAEGVDLGQAAKRAQELAREVLSDKTGIALLGEASSLQESQSGTTIVFATAFLVVLLVLSAQFESVASAAVIMLTVPFGLGAAILAIKLTGGSLNYYSQIGLVMLIGIMAKNGILIVEFANQLREEGSDVQTAIREAIELRLRPVMMTMISTVFGGLPLALAAGAGAEARIAVGWVVVGGLGFATIFTLTLTPVFYTLIAPYSAIPGHSAKRAMQELDESTVDI